LNSLPLIHLVEDAGENEEQDEDDEEELHMMIGGFRKGRYNDWGRKARKPR
jgi:hypothetical protein